MWIHFLPTFPLKKPSTFAQNPESVYDQTDIVEGVNKSWFKELLSLATKESFEQTNRWCSYGITIRANCC